MMRWSWLLAACIAFSSVTAAAENYADRVMVQPVRLYMKNDRGRAVISVTNNSAETLDIDVGCIFYKGDTKVGSGSATVSRLPPRHSDTLDIPDRQSNPLDAVRCDVSRAEK
jgi:hypothetical protein